MTDAEWNRIIVKIEGLGAWMKKHSPDEREVARQFRAGDNRNNYGVTGRSRTIAPGGKERKADADIAAGRF